MGWRDFQAAPPREFMESMELMTIETPLIPLIPLIPIESAPENMVKAPVPVILPGRANDTTAPTPWVSWQVMGTDTPDISNEESGKIETPLRKKWKFTPPPPLTDPAQIEQCRICADSDYWTNHFVCRRCHNQAEGVLEMTLIPVTPRAESATEGFSFEELQEAGILPFEDAPTEVFPEGHIWHKWNETPILAATTAENKCRACGGVDYWQSAIQDGVSVCRVCHPPMVKAERITA